MGDVSVRGKSSPITPSGGYDLDPYTPRTCALSSPAAREARLRDRGEARAGGLAVCRRRHEDGDLGDADAARALVERAVEELGGLDVLVNGAAAGSSRNRWKTYRGGLGRGAGRDREGLLLRHAGGGPASEVERRRGRDARGRRRVPAWPSFAPHSAAKAAQAMLTRSLRARARPEVRVCGVAPGPVVVDHGQEERRAAETLLAKLAHPTTSRTRCSILPTPTSSPGRASSSTEEDSCNPAVFRERRNRWKPDVLCTVTTKRLAAAPRLRHHPGSGRSDEQRRDDRRRADRARRRRRRQRVRASRMRYPAGIRARPPAARRSWPPRTPSRRPSRRSGAPPGATDASAGRARLGSTPSPGNAIVDRRRTLGAPPAEAVEEASDEAWADERAEVELDRLAHAPRPRRAAGAGAPPDRARLLGRPIAERDRRVPRHPAGHGQDRNEKCVVPPGPTRLEESSREPPSRFPRPRRERSRAGRAGTARARPRHADRRRPAARAPRSSSPSRPVPEGKLVDLARRRL